MCACVCVCTCSPVASVHLCVKGEMVEKGREGGSEGGSVSLPNGFPGCVTARRRWAGQREVPSRNRESDVSCYTPQLKEEGKRK